METVYIPGDAAAFKLFIDAHYKDDTVELRNIEGHNRWVIKREDGTEYIARPESVEPPPEDSYDSEDGIE